MNAKDVMLAQHRHGRPRSSSLPRRPERRRPDGPAGRGAEPHRLAARPPDQLRADVRRRDQARLVPAAARRVRRSAQQGDEHVGRPVEVPAQGRSTSTSTRPSAPRPRPCSTTLSEAELDAPAPSRSAQMLPDRRHDVQPDRPPRPDARRPVRQRPAEAEEAGDDLSREAPASPEAPTRSPPRSPARSRRSRLPTQPGPTARRTARSG